MFGRDGEMHALDQLIQRLAAGTGGAVWMQGEPGIGKTTLLAEAAERARRAGCQCYLVRSELLQVFPLQILLEALEIRERTTDLVRAGVARVLRGDASKLSAPQDTSAVLAEQILTLVDRLCATSPVVLVLDDAQWADDATLGVWLRLAATVAQRPLLLITAARPVPQRAALDVLRRRLADSGAIDLDLGPLSPPAVTDLVVGILGATPTPALHERLAEAAGNPLYLREILDALRRENQVRIDAGIADLPGGAVVVPGSLHAAISRRLSFLSAATAAMLRLAALLGPAFSVAELSVVSGRPATELIPEIDEAVRAGVLVESGEQLLFRHGLIHQALYQAMPASLRSALHQQAAAALAEAGASVERITEQLVAGPATIDTRMVDWVDQNAPSLTYRAPRLIANLLDQTRAGIPADDRRRERIEVHLATALFLLGEGEAMEQVAAPLLASTEDPDTYGRMAWLVAEVYHAGGQYERAAVLTDEAMGRPDLPAVWAARINAVRATVQLYTGHDLEALATAREAEQAALRIGDREGLAIALYAQALYHAWRRHNYSMALSLVERALTKLGSQPESVELRLRLLSGRVTHLFNLGRCTEAEQVLGVACAAAENGGAPRRLAILRLQKAEIDFFLGRLDECRAELDLLDAQNLGVAALSSYQGLCMLLAVHQGQRERVADQLASTGEAVRTMEETQRYYGRYGLNAWALSAEAEGDPKQALERMQFAFDPESTGQFPVLVSGGAMWLPDVVRLALAAGEEDTARTLTEAAEAAAEAGRELGIASRHCRGLLKRDPAEVQAAAGMLAELGYRLYRAHALENAAVLWAERGDTSEARRLYNDAVATYVDVDAAWDLTRVTTRMRRYGVRRGVRGPRRRPTTGWQALTPTEVRIAHLVASGASNPDIAAQLYVSRRTVETHVSHILAKLQAQSRVEIARTVALVS
jgi:DNA-binding CsgD family transcriptional regulator